MTKPAWLLLPWIFVGNGVIVASAFVASPQRPLARDAAIPSASVLRRIDRLRRRPTERLSSPSHAAASSSSVSVLPRISHSDVAALSETGYVVVPDFLPRTLVDELRADVSALRSASAFRAAKIGQDSTNELNAEIRVAETCFLGRNRPELTSIASAGGTSSVRDREGGLYDVVLDGLCDALEENSPSGLDRNLNELLYAYYPRGGYYRRHRDAVPGSASVLRKYSLLLYLNEEGWDPEVDAGQLRLHLDGGGDECPPGVEPRYVDVDPLGGTLVLFKSEMVPHEVLNTNSERFALVGWYNRGVTAGDIGNLGEAGGGGDVVRLGMMVAAMALVTFGVVSIIGQ